MSEILLTIDTSQSAASAAVFRNAELLSSALAESGMQASAGIAELVAVVLTRAGVGRGEIGRITVSTGPGSLTGLRVGLAFARGLADALGIECVERSLFSFGGGGIEAAYAGSGMVTFVDGGEPVSVAFDDWVTAAAVSARVWTVSADLGARIERSDGPSPRYVVGAPAACLLGAG